MFTRDNWFDNVEDRSHPWPGVNWVTTMLIVPDVKRAVDFYQNAFGFIPIFAPGMESGHVTFARMRYRGTGFTLNREGAFQLEGKAPETTGQVPAFYMYMYVDDVKAAFATAIAAGCKEMQKPTVAYWGDKVGRVRDVHGYIWDLATRCSEE